MSKTSFKNQTKRGESLLAAEARTETLKFIFRHCLINNLGKILIFFSSSLPSLVKRDQPGWCSHHVSGSVLADVLLTLALSPVADRPAIHPLWLETWPGLGSAWGFVLLASLTTEVKLFL